MERGLLTGVGGVVLMIPTKVYPCHNRGKPPVLMIPAKVYPCHNRGKPPVLMIPTKAIHR